MSDALRDNLLTFVLGGGNLFLIIKFFIERHDKKKEKEEDNVFDKISAEIVALTEELKKVKKDGIRTQLLFMILLRPQEQQEIMKLGECYFKKLEGNWYMTSIFSKWLTEYKIAKPEWFISE